MGAGGSPALLAAGDGAGGRREEGRGSGARGERVARPAHRGQGLCPGPAPRVWGAHECTSGLTGGHGVDTERTRGT